MKTLNRYIGVEIVKGSLVSIIVLLTLYNFVTFADELDDLGKGNYGLKQIFEYLALTSPRNFYELMPTAALIGSLFTLGAMGNFRELLAMRVAGVSLLQMITAVLKAGLIIAAITVLVGEIIAPDSERSAQLLKATALKKQIALETKYGLWLRDGNTFINVRILRQGENLGDISIYEFDNNQHLSKASHADNADFINQYWHLKNLKRTNFSTAKITTESADEEIWESFLDPEIVDIVVVKPENLSLLGLFKYIGFLRKNSQDSQPFELAFWGRLVNPLTTLVMLIVAVPFVFHLKQIMNTGQRIVIGVLIGLGFYLFDRMFGYLALIYGFNPAFASVFPALLILTMAVFAIRKYC